MQIQTSNRRFVWVTHFRVLLLDSSHLPNERNNRKISVFAYSVCEYMRTSPVSISFSSELFFSFTMIHDELLRHGLWVIHDDSSPTNLFTCLSKIRPLVEEECVLLNVWNNKPRNSENGKIFLLWDSTPPTLSPTRRERFWLQLSSWRNHRTHNNEKTEKRFEIVIKVLARWLIKHAHTSHCSLIFLHASVSSSYLTVPFKMTFKVTKTMSWRC